MSAPIIGVHPPDAGGIPIAVRRAAAAGAKAVQVFTAPPTYYNEKVSFKPPKVQAAHAALADVGLAPSAVFVHAAYVLNTASPEEEKALRARNGLAKEFERTTALAAYGCCFHPGSAGDSAAEDAAVRVGTAIRHAVESVAETGSGTRVLIENTAGAGRTMGRTPEEIAIMLEQVPRELRHRTGYGLDTCHLFAAGHPIHESAERLREVLDTFERVIGEAPAFFHLNDSQHPFGSNKDRHAWIGEGAIGAEPFRWLLQDPRTRGIPCILETPAERKEVADDDASADPADTRMVALLSGFLDG
ncbi:MAG: deoxyribonuclease IV [Gemmatimonadaceae bacterium]|nr:deoxyribonuclease IV [Gemmatimonadaceae bacterium]